MLVIQGILPKLGDFADSTMTALFVNEAEIECGYIRALFMSTLSIVVK